MTRSKLLQILEKRILPFVFLFISIRNIIEVDFKSSSYFAGLDDIIRPLLFSIFLFLSPTQSRILSVKSAIGLLFSYIPLLFFSYNSISSSIRFSHLTNILVLASLVYYLILFSVSIFNLGTSFSIVPAVSQLKTKGMYREVKHPLYSCYLHCTIIYLIFSPTYLNLTLFLFFVLGLFLRATEEEKVLIESFPEYNEIFKHKNRFVSYLFSFPVLIILSSSLIPTSVHDSHKVRMSYPVYSLNPLLADDWSSFLAINHIYPRFSKKDHGARSGILSKLSIRCKNNLHSIFSNNCNKFQVEFEVRANIKSCDGKKYNSDHFKKELKEIASKKNWLLPEFSWCTESTNCFEIKAVKDIQPRLDSIYMRFGWSLDTGEKNNYGIYPNCLKITSRKNQEIHGYEFKNDSLSFSAQTDKNINFDLDLYGLSSSVSHSPLPFYNPIYYFLVLNGKFENQSRLLSSRHFKELRATLSEKGIIRNDSNSSMLFESFKHKFVEDSQENIDSLNVVLPDYLENCESLSKELSKNLHPLIFTCQNISLFVERVVKENRKEWDAFVSPLTPGMGGKDGLKTQYFNSQSNDSWLGKSNPNNSSFILLGIDNGVVSARNGVFCGIKPNPLGLSDLLISDLQVCEK